MTTIAMVAGMLPTALALGAGGEFRAPMAIAVIGGLIVSTMLSLVFVPAFFILMDDLSRLFSWLFGRFVGPTDEDAGPGRGGQLRRRAPRPRGESLSAGADEDRGGIGAIRLSPLRERVRLCRQAERRR